MSLESRSSYGFYGAAGGYTGETSFKTKSGKGGYQYYIWTVDMQFPTGRYTVEIKARSEENAIKQIKKMYKASRSEKNLQLPPLLREPLIQEIYWNTFEKGWW